MPTYKITEPAYILGTYYPATVFNPALVTVPSEADKPKGGVLVTVAPVITNATLESRTSAGFSFSWDTDLESTTNYRIREVGAADWTEGEASETDETEHTLVIEGLDPGISWEIQIVSEAADGAEGTQTFFAATLSDGDTGIVISNLVVTPHDDDDPVACLFEFDVNVPADGSENGFKTAVFVPLGGGLVSTAQGDGTPAATHFAISVTQSLGGNTVYSYFIRIERETGVYCTALGAFETNDPPA